MKSVLKFVEIHNYFDLCFKEISKFKSEEILTKDNRIESDVRSVLTNQSSISGAKSDIVSAGSKTPVNTSKQNPKSSIFSEFFLEFL